LPYLAPADLREILRPDDDSFDNSAGSLDDPQLAIAILDAQTLVDSYTGTAYDDDDVPPFIITLTKHVAAYYATLTQNKNQAIDKQDPTLLRFQAAMQMLENIANGVINPVPQREDAPTDLFPGMVAVQNQYVGALFTMQDFGLGYGHWRGY
jgi:phage gp36-like protein